MREASAISLAPRSTFTPTSFAPPRAGRASSSVAAIARCRSPRSRNGRWSRKRESPGSASRRCARYPATNDEVLLVPLPGHTRGHCGVAVRRSDDWLLHCGDAYFHRSEVEPGSGEAPPGLRAFERLIERQRRRAARQSGSPARARAADDGRGQALLLARSGRVCRAEGRRASGVEQRGRTPGKTPSRPLSAPAPRRAQYRDIRAAE